MGMASFTLPIRKQRSEGTVTGLAGVSQARKGWSQVWILVCPDIQCHNIPSIPYPTIPYHTILKLLTTLDNELPQLGCLILCVSLTRPWNAQTFDQTLFSVLMWRCFCVRVMFNLVARVKHVAHPNVGRPHPINWMEQKGWPLSQIKCFPPCRLWIWTETLASPGPWAWGLSDWSCTTSSPGAP